MLYPIKTDCAVNFHNQWRCWLFVEFNYWCCILVIVMFPFYSVHPDTSGCIHRKCPHSGSANSFMSDDPCQNILWEVYCSLNSPYMNMRIRHSSDPNLQPRHCPLQQFECFFWWLIPCVQVPRQSSIIISIFTVSRLSHNAFIFLGPARHIVWVYHCCLLACCPALTFNNFMTGTSA